MVYTEDNTHLEAAVDNGTPARPRKPRTSKPPASNLAAQQLALRNAASMRRGELVRELKELDEAFGFGDGVAVKDPAPAPKPVRNAAPRKTATVNASADDAATKKAILDYVTACGVTGAKLGDVCKEVDVTKPGAAKILKALVKAGSLTTEGKNRGMIYVAP